VSGGRLDELALRLGPACRRRGVMVATAESCTGGLVAEAITRVAGSSAWFDRGFVTYSYAAKTDLLGVDAALIAVHGAVSEPVALAMAEGALVASSARVAVALTGIAGPGGGTPAKPVGTVWIAWAARGEPAQARIFHFGGDRAAVRLQSAEVALQGLLDLLGDVHA
jgi:nicotinamide-nucleotide amidase